MDITILGMGAMGSRMADRLEAANHQVTRWNRSGATQTPREAVTGADVIIAMLRDDDASKMVWLGLDGALKGMKANALAIESSTLTVDWVKTLAKEFELAGKVFIDAPVLGSRTQAETGLLIHLIGGDHDTVERAKAVLSAIGSSYLHAGPVGQGAALKLVANTLFGVQVAVLAELLARMPAFGLNPADAIALLNNTPILSPAAKGAAALMLENKHDAMFPVQLVAKDFGYAIGDAANVMPVVDTVRLVFERAIANGLGDANLTAIAQLYR